MPRRDEPRTTVRWSEEEYRELTQLAEMAGVKAGPLVRATFLRYGVEYAASLRAAQVNDLVEEVLSARTATVPPAGKAASSRAVAAPAAFRPVAGAAPALDSEDVGD